MIFFEYAIFLIVKVCYIWGCVLLYFVTYSAAPARCEPHRLLSFAQPSLNLRSTFAQPSLGRILNSELAEYEKVCYVFLF